MEVERRLRFWNDRQIMRKRPQIATIVVGVGALLGVFFASVSTSDFAMHLDRQVHDVHCSFIPGAAPETGESGCQVTLVSQYSSVFRTTVWGGVPSTPIGDRPASS